MSKDYRETTIRVAGVERVIRTDGQRTVKLLEAAHTKAVKAALIEMRKVGAASLRERAAKVGDGGKGEYSKLANRWEGGVFASHGTYEVAAMRKPFPKARFTDETPAYLVEIAPGEFATAEAAESMGADEMAEELLPGLELRRYTDKTWVLHHLHSATEGRPEGFHLGPVFKSKARAREVAALELAGLDWTRTADELKADEYTAATVKAVKLREFVAASKRNAWAVEELREAEEALTEMNSVMELVA